MRTRRDFIKSAAALTAAAATPAANPLRASLATKSIRAVPALGKSLREEWCALASKLAQPVLSSLARREFRKTFPIEAAAGVTDRAQYSHLEAFARLLTGLAPWLELEPDDSPEGELRGKVLREAHAAIDAATDPASPDYMNFSRGQQPLVDGAFLAEAFVRSPHQLWAKLEPRVQNNVVAALKSSRIIQPPENNWHLFAALVEVFLQGRGEARDEARFRGALERFSRWYLGDGLYGDGKDFHWDYYNSFVIHPMLFEALESVRNETPGDEAFYNREKLRLSRYAQIQERLISPDGSFPVIGRSIAYRCGAFHALAFAAWRGLLPPEMPGPQARTALDRVIRKTMHPPEAWTNDGWLRIGLSGHQPALGETYISTGSLYLCSVAFLPLGLPPDSDFWAGAPAATTWDKIWSGENLPADHAVTAP